LKNDEKLKSMSRHLKGILGNSAAVRDATVSFIIFPFSFRSLLIFSN
jgi:hypothetical protein